MIAKMLISQDERQDSASPKAVQRSHVTSVEVIHRLHMAQPGDELHHLGWHLVLFIDSKDPKV